MKMDLEYNQVAKIKVFGIGGAGCNAVNRMVEIGVGFCPIGDTMVPVLSPGDFQIGGKYSMQIIDNFVRHEYGVEIITDTPVTNLTVEDGKVCGFTAKSVDGTTYQVKADAVILASGGYIMNNDLYEEYQADDMKFPRTGPFWADGSGMLMARDVAGNIIEYPTDFEIPAPITYPDFGGGGGGFGGGSGGGGGSSRRW